MPDQRHPACGGSVSPTIHQHLAPTSPKLGCGNRKLMSTIRVALSSLSSFEIVVGPQRRTEMGGCRWGQRQPIAPGESALAMQQQRAVRSCLSVGFSTRFEKRNCPPGLASDGTFTQRAQNPGPIPRQSVGNGIIADSDAASFFPEMSDECLVYICLRRPYRRSRLYRSVVGSLREQGCACLRPSPCAGLLVAKAH